MPPRRRALAATAALAGLLGALLCVLVVTGQLALVVTSGVSMQPTYHEGDLVIIAARSDYAVGDVVAYSRTGHSGVVLHRITGGGPSGWVFQGDNNATVDPTQPVTDQLVGPAAFHIPRGGIWLRRLTSPPALAAYTFLLLAGGAAATTTTKRQRRKERRTVSPRHRTTPARSLGSLPPALLPLAATAAAVGLLGAVLGGLSWTRPTTTTTAALDSVDSSIDFSYTATVPQSAAYDGTTVVAPQPVFRTLTDTVDVTYAYDGRPGTIAVEAELSTASGWRSTIELAGVQPLPGQHQGRVTLDLRALEDRAEAAAAVTGIPAGNLTVTVIPKIDMAGGGEFAPRLPLTLDSLTLKPSGEDALSASTSTSAEATGTAPATLSALGRSLDVGTARKASLLALLGAVLAAVALAATARLAGPVDEAERIRARHKALLLPVLPIVLPPGRPVVDVPDMDTLTTLAERYGLLVLHWSRSGVETYIVQDEGTTYRYRSGTGVSTAARPLPVA